MSYDYDLTVSMVLASLRTAILTASRYISQFKQAYPEIWSLFMYFLVLYVSAKLVLRMARMIYRTASNPVYSDSAVSSAKDDCYIFGRNADQIRLEEFFKGGSRPPTGLSEGHAEPIRDSLPAETGLSHTCADVAGVILMYFVATYGRVQSPKSEW
ncbi:hypothetical protein KL918_002457 [Ogataea parapolymorpha]|nr:hypothetical protein KL918_002457 [Ogataea parapolymorpha]KAG7870699.1 hypothetical protein KL916_004747 [Ogataea parapolymorpha]